MRQRRFRSARCHRQAGDELQAAEELEQLLAEVPHGVERADLLFELSLNLHTAPHALIELLDQALDEAAGDDARLVRILGFRSWIRVFQADISAALPDARAALEKAELVGDPALIAAAIGQVATAEGRAGEVTPGCSNGESSWRSGSVWYSDTARAPRSRSAGGWSVWASSTEPVRFSSRPGRRLPHVARNDSDVKWTGVSGGSNGLPATGSRLSTTSTSPRPLRVASHAAPPGYTGRLRALAEADLGLVEQARSSAAAALAAPRRCRTGMEDPHPRRTRTSGADARKRGGRVGLPAQAPRRALSTGYEDPTTPLWADSIEALIAGGSS